MDVLKLVLSSYWRVGLLDSRWSGLYTWKENKATAARGREERTSVNTQQQANDDCRVCCGTWGFLETLLHVQTSYLCYAFAVELVWKTGLWLMQVSNPNPISQYPGCIDFFFFFLLLKWKSHHSHDSERHPSALFFVTHIWLRTRVPCEKKNFLCYCFRVNNFSNYCTFVSSTVCAPCF